MLFWVWDLGAGCDMVRSSWLMSYACLYTTRRLQIQLCLIINKIENIKLHKILQKRHWPSLMSTFFKQITGTIPGDVPHRSFQLFQASRYRQFLHIALAHDVNTDKGTLANSEP